MSLRETFDHYLDNSSQPDMGLFHQVWPAFQVCGYTGLGLAIVLSLTLVIQLSLSLWVMVQIILAAVLMFLGLVMATKIITGRESIINYHHQIAVMVVAAILLKLMRQSVLPSRHVRQVAELLAATRARAAGTGKLHIGQTSQGIRISASRLQAGARRLDMFAFSCQDAAFSVEAAQKFARLIAHLRQCGAGFEFLKGASGVYHLILPAERSAHAL
jgi:hypothetical protein